MAVEERIANAPKGIIPERGQLPADARTKLFVKQAEKVSASIKHVASIDDVPKAVSSYLRSKNLPASVRIGADKRLAKMPWADQKALEVSEWTF
jgi:L-lactate dehydrogenase complex protein LldG